MPTTRGFCIFIDTICDGPTPIERHGNGRIVFYKSIEEARREVAEIVIDRLTQFLDGAYSFDDAMSTEEYIVEVDYLPDGSIVEHSGRICS